MATPSHLAQPRPVVGRGVQRPALAAPLAPASGERERLSRLVLAGERRGGGGGDPESLARGFLVTGRSRHHAEVVLDHRVARKLGDALLEEGPCALVRAPPVEDPAEDVGDVRILGGLLLGGLGESQRPVPLAAVLGENPGQVVDGRGEARSHSSG